MQMVRQPERPGGTLGRKSEWFIMEFSNSSFVDLVNPEKLFFIGNRNFEFYAAFSMLKCGRLAVRIISILVQLFYTVWYTNGGH